jgi:hypothetical protein
MTLALYPSLPRHPWGHCPGWCLSLPHPPTGCRRFLSGSRRSLWWLRKKPELLKPEFQEGVEKQGSQVQEAPLSVLNLLPNLLFNSVHLASLPPPTPPWSFRRTGNFCWTMPEKPSWLVVIKPWGLVTRQNSHRFPRNLEPGSTPGCGHPVGLFCLTNEEERMFQDLWLHYGLPLCWEFPTESSALDLE